MNRNKDGQRKENKRKVKEVKKDCVEYSLTKSIFRT